MFLNIFVASVRLSLRVAFVLYTIPNGNHYNVAENFQVTAPRQRRKSRRARGFFAFFGMRKCHLISLYSAIVVLEQLLNVKYKKSIL